MGCYAAGSDPLTDNDLPSRGTRLLRLAASHDTFNNTKNDFGCAEKKWRSGDVVLVVTNDVTDVARRTREERGQLGSVLKALDILDLLSEQPEGVGVSQVANRLGISVGAAFSTLATLLSRGYVEQDRERGKYRLGPKVFVLAQRMSSDVNLRRMALPVLEELSARTGETAVLSVVRQQQVWYLARIQSNQPLVVQFGRENNPYFHSHGQGKVHLAYMPGEEAEALIHRTGLPQVGPQTITNPDVLRAELERVRREGIAFNYEESNAGVFGLGAPVHDFTGAIVAAVGFAAPVTRATPERVPEYVAAVKEAARQTSSRLGYRPPS